MTERIVLPGSSQVKVAVTRCPALGPNVNTPEDLEAVRKILSNHAHSLE